MSTLTGRLAVRRNRIWARSFLTYHYLWPNIEAAIGRARQAIASENPVVLDVGCGERPYEDLFSGCTYWGLNYGTEHASPDLVGTALALPIRDAGVDLVFATRNPEQYSIPVKPFIQYGASPRATIYLAVAAKAHAFVQQRGYVTPQDVKSIGPDVLRHRVIVSYEAEAEDKTSEDVIKTIFDSIEVP